MSDQTDPKAKLLLMSPKNVEISGNFPDIFVQYLSRIKDTNTQINIKYKQSLLKITKSFE
jgi:hypothetical protein